FDAQGLLVSVLGATFALYLTYTVVNEQYALWFLPFAIITLPKIRTLRLGTITISAVAFIYDIFYFLSPILDSDLTPLRNAWISNAWKSFEAGSLMSGLMVAMSLVFSLI